MTRTTSTSPVAPPPRARAPDRPSDAVRLRELAGDFARLVTERREAQSRTLATSRDDRVRAAADVDASRDPSAATDGRPDRVVPKRGDDVSAVPREAEAVVGRRTAREASDTAAVGIAVSDALADDERRAEEASDDETAAAPRERDDGCSCDVWLPVFDAFGNPLPEHGVEGGSTREAPDGETGRVPPDGSGATATDIVRLLAARVADGDRSGYLGEPGRWRFSFVGTGDEGAPDEFVVTRLDSGELTVTFDTGRTRPDGALDELARRLAAFDEPVLVEVHDRCEAST